MPFSDDDSYIKRPEGFKEAAPPLTECIYKEEVEKGLFQCTHPDVDVGLYPCQYEKCPFPSAFPVDAPVTITISDPPVDIVSLNIQDPGTVDDHNDLIDKWRTAEEEREEWKAKYEELVKTNEFMIKRNQDHIFKLNVIITFLKEWFMEAAADE